MKRIALATLLAFTSVIAAPVATAAAAQKPAASPLAIPVTGAGPGGAFAGTFQLQKFVAQDGQVVATGVLTGVVTTTAGVATTIVRTIALPTVIGTATCDILHLDLGPVSIDLLGLQIDLSRIVLDITAQAGAGNLLGNLLCAVANLLNDPSGLARLLNSVLDLLR
ncbi:MAG TPA: hypothetical protein VNJ04_07795 [Gemmatimonadaceae bacterium]|nr:hypothetical protein [Gemmatimonadaceae bacterium]